MEFKEDVKAKKKKNNYLFTGISVVFSILLIIILLYIKYNAIDEKNTFVTLTFASLFIFIWIIFSWYYKEKSIFNSYTVFMLFSILFYFGQPIAFLLGAKTESLKVYSIKIYPYSTLNETLLYILTSYLLIHIGGLLSRNKPIELKKKEINIDYSTGMNTVGIMLLAISVVPTMILLFNSFKAVLASGYIGLFITSNTIAINSGLFGVLAGFFIPSLYMLIIANSKIPFKRNLYTIITLIYIFSVFFLGRRGENTIYLLGLIIIWHNLIKPITRKKTLVFLISGLIFTFSLSILSQIRASLNTGDIGTLIIKSITETNFTEIIYDILAEFGVTLLVPATIIHYVPEVLAYYDGKTIVNFFLNLIPNFFWDINPGLKDGTLENIVTSFVRKGSVGGIGGSFLAEIFYNFGYYSYILLPFYGVVLSKLSNYMDMRTTRGGNKLNFYAAIYLFTIILWFIRGEVMTSGKRVIYFVVFPIIMVNIISKYKKYKNT